MLDSGGESAPTTPAARPSLRGKGCAENSGLSHHVHVVRALEWVAVGDAAGRQGPAGCPWGRKPGPGRSVSAKWNPCGPIFKAICRAELFLCLHVRTPHSRAQPGKMCAVRASAASGSSRNGTGSCSAPSLPVISLSGPSPTLG